ncbi:immunity 22 family protein, partial [Enterovibrio norvegicus]|uniref:immunity 22 family protein n=1 Tax=Enterovibrio norvegicus TaxID=188144 RepID=UPI001A7E19A8
ARYHSVRPITLQVIMADLDHAHIWAAFFPSEEVQEEIFREQHGDDEAAMNSFAASQGESFYDHDFFYIEEVKSEGIDHALKECGVPEINIPNITIAWGANAEDQHTSIVVGDSGDFDSPVSCVISGAEFKYLGCFQHWSKKV